MFYLPVGKLAIDNAEISTYFIQLFQMKPVEILK
jgi:hypothetical protein